MKALPESIVKAVKAAYPECEFDEAEKITRGSTIEYEIVVEVDESEFELLVASDGRILSSDQMDEDDDDDDDEE